MLEEKDGDSIKSNQIEILEGKVYVNFKKMEDINTFFHEKLQLLEQEKVELENKILNLEERMDGLRKQNYDLDTKVSGFNEKLERKANITSLQENYRELSNRIHSKADESKVLSRYDLNKLEERNEKRVAFYSCLFICTILVFNIVLSWLILYRPGYLSFMEEVKLPWFCIVPLLSITLINVVAVIIWFYHFNRSTFDFKQWGKTLEIVLLIFSTVTLWLFSYHPITEITGAIIALFIFLMFNSILMIIRKILFFANEYNSFDIDYDMVSPIIYSFETVFFIIIFILYVSCVRV